MTPLRALGGLRRRRRLRDTYQECQARLATLDLDGASDIREVCTLLWRQRDRAIHLLPIALDSAGPSGFWLAADEIDLIIFERNTSALHQEHIIAHELAHMICCHHSAAVSDDCARSLFPALDPRLVREMLGRDGYSDTQELAAEMLATLMLLRLKAPGPDTADEITVVRHIGDSLA
jgi:hypothetical protein